MLKNLALRTAALAVAMMIGQAYAADTKRIDVPAGELTLALETLAKQSGVEFVYEVQQLKGLRTKGVHGELTPENAVAKLLEGTQLVVTMHRSGAVLIAAPQANSAAGTAAEATKLRLANSESDESMKKVENTGNTKAFNSAEPSSEDSAPKGIQEIVVTAQKREERAIDVPISIVALGSDELQKRKVTSLDDLSLAVPGLAIRSTGSYSRQITMRGVSNTFGGSSLIGIYLDEAPATSPSTSSQLDVRTYDLERVEVLRGPQGTLYGEGSAGGTIRFITSNPQLDRFGMNANAAALFTEHGSPGERIEGALDIPVIEDVLGFRLSGTFDHEGGWIDQPAAGRKDFNDQNLVNMRLKGLWQPTPEFTVNAMAVAHRNDAPPNKAEDADGTFTQVFNQTTTPTGQDDYNLYNLTLSYDFPAFRVLSASSYVDQYKAFDNNGAYRQYTLPGTPRFDVLSARRLDARAVTEEFRLSSLGSRPLEWTLGAYLQNTRYEDRTLFTYFAIPGPPGTPLPAPLPASRSSVHSDSWAIFGDASYKLTDRLMLGTGLRYFEDERKDIPSVQSGKFHSLSPRVYTQFRLTDHVNTYASAAKGFRSGGFNALGRPKYDPETVWTYELGSKMYLLDGRLSTDLAAFHTDYKDYQIIGVVFTPTGGFNITSNAGDARIRGIELATTWHPVGQWTLSFNGDYYLDAEFVKIDATPASYDVGDDLDHFPKYQFAVSGQHDFAWNGKQGFARLDYNKQGHMTFRNRNAVGPSPWYFSQSDIIDMLNFNMSLDWSDNLSLGLFAQNLLNEHGYTGSNVIEGSAARARPRTYGLQFGVTF